MACPLCPDHNPFNRCEHEQADAFRNVGILLLVLAAACFAAGILRIIGVF